MYSRGARPSTEKNLKMCHKSYGREARGAVTICTYSTCKYEY